jgi:hypothetical protein
VHGAGPESALRAGLPKASSEQVQLVGERVAGDIYMSTLGSLAGTGVPASGPSAGRFSLFADQ